MCVGLMAEQEDAWEIQARCHDGTYNALITDERDDADENH